MNSTLHFPTSLRCAFETPNRGVTDLVDDLLQLCPEQGLLVEFDADRCLVRSLTGNSEVIDSPLRKSVFRALLARLAALCNQWIPDSVSPYGGKAYLQVRSDPVRLFQVSFANTPSEQWLTLTPLTVDELLPRIQELEVQAAEQSAEIESLKETVDQLTDRLRDATQRLLTLNVP